MGLSTGVWGLGLDVVFATVWSLGMTPAHCIFHTRYFIFIYHIPYIIYTLCYITENIYIYMYFIFILYVIDCTFHML